jgi:hypothetical protein
MRLSPVHMAVAVAVADSKARIIATSRLLDAGRSLPSTPPMVEIKPNLAMRRRPSSLTLIVVASSSNHRHLIDTPLEYKSRRDHGTFKCRRSTFLAR